MCRCSVWRTPKSESPAHTHWTHTRDLLAHYGTNEPPLYARTQILAYQFFLELFPVQDLLKPRSSQVGHGDHRTPIAEDRQKMAARLPPEQPNFLLGGGGLGTRLSACRGARPYIVAMCIQCREHIHSQRFVHLHISKLYAMAV